MPIEKIESSRYQVLASLSSFISDKLQPMVEPEQNGRLGTLRIAVLVLGCAGAVWLIVGTDLQPGHRAVSTAAGVAVLMATLWITEVIPLAVTSLLPVILFPLFGIQDGKEVAREYFNDVIFLFIGGFIVALAMQRWNLHERIALRILLWFGTQPARLLLGFMAATAVLSMWISNTAATMMMVTIAAAVLATMDHQSSKRTSVPLLLGIAYAASVGGIATLVGTPPNMALVRMMAISFPGAPPISFTSWMIIALPTSLVMFGLVWILLWSFFLRGRVVDPIRKEILRSQYQELGAMDWPQWVVLTDFLLLVALWIFRADIDLGFTKVAGWSNWLPESNYVNDGTVAILMAFLLFLIPSGNRAGEKVIDWSTAVRLPWHIVLLFGGGFALASGIMHSGLSQWLGEQMQALAGVNPLLIVALVCLAITFLTELTSNTATTQMILPILATLAVSIGIHPVFLMVPVTISCSCAFMMPVATPPNAIVFGTGQLRIDHMVKAGFVLNLLGVMVVVAMAYFLLPSVWDFQIDQLPDWAVTGETTTSD